jgi:hypothetical protein
MKRFVAGADRGQWTLLPECLDDFTDESNPVRVIDVFVDALDLAEMSFQGAEPAATGRPSYHPLFWFIRKKFIFLKEKTHFLVPEAAASRDIFRAGTHSASKQI